MNLKKVFEIFQIIKDRLPETYPQARLAFYEDENCLLDNMGIERGDFSIYGVVDPETYTISLPLRMNLESKNEINREVIYKSIPIDKFKSEEIASTILHELCHLYAGNRYGWSSKQYKDEAYCDRFAKRWVDKLKKEKLI